MSEEFLQWFSRFMDPRLWEYLRPEQKAAWMQAWQQ